MKHKLSYVLAKATELPWDFELFMPFDKPVTLEMDCLVLDLSEYDDGDQHPEAEKLGFRYVIGIHQVQAIVENARLQDPNATEAQLLAALMYYLRNDAFVEF